MSGFLRPLAAAAVLFVGACASASVAVAAPGDPDVTLNGTGRLALDLDNSRMDLPRALHVRDDQRVVVAGTVRLGNGTARIALWHYTAGGAPDTTVAPAGLQLVPIPGGATTFTIEDVAVDGSGRVLVAGTTGSDASERLALVRITAAGLADTTFDGDGLVSPAYAGIDRHAATSLVVQPDGKVVAGGRIVDGGEHYSALFRFTAAGAVDTTWNTVGYQQVNLATGAEQINSVAVFANGDATYDSVVAAGFAPGSSGTAMTVWRLQMSNGQAAAGFANTGVATIDFGSAVDERATDVAVFDPNTTMNNDARIVAAGHATSDHPSGPATKQIALVSVSFGSGALDSGFDGDGKVLTRLDGGSGGVGAAAEGLAFRDPDTAASGGETLTVGVHRSDTVALEGSGVVARYLASSGGLDPGFDGDGLTSVLPEVTTAGDLVVDASGRAIALGHGEESAGVLGFDLIATRLTTAGALDSGWDGDGTRRDDSGEIAGDDITSVARDPAGGVVFGGTTMTAGRLAPFALRLGADAGPDASFDADGVALATGIDAQQPVSVGVAPDRRVVLAAGGTDAVGATTVAVYPLTATGAPDASWPLACRGGCPQRTWTADGAYVGPRAMVAADSQGRWVVAYHHARDVLVRRLTADGQDDSTFNGGVPVTIPRPAGSEALTVEQVLLDDSDRPVVVGRVEQASAGLRTSYVWRGTLAGAPLDGFGDGGRATFDVGDGTRDAAMSASVEGSAVRVAGAVRISGQDQGFTARLDAGGALDASHGGDGVAIQSVDLVSAAGFLPDGRALLGAHYSGLLGLRRVSDAGTLDSTLAGGVAYAGGIGGTASGFGAGLIGQADGRMVFGVGGVTSQGRSVLGIARFTGDLADLSAGVSAPAGASPGSEATVSLSVTNAGEQDARDVRLTGSVPAGTGVLSVGGEGFTCSPAPAIDCRTARLPALTTRTATVVLQLPGADADVDVSAAATSVTADPDAGDRSATGRIAVRAPASGGETSSGTLPATGTGTGTGAAAPSAPDASAPAPPRRDRSAPRTRLRVPRVRLAALLRRGVRVSLTGNEALTGRLELRLRRGRRSTTLARRSVALVKAGRRTTVLRLGPRGRRALRRAGRRPRLQLVLVARDRAGNRSRTTKRVRLRR